MSFSLVINHTPWRPERATALEEMLKALAPMPEHVLINSTDYRGRNWQEAKVDWALTQWRWAKKTSASHHVFLTDDLHIAPNFWRILDAMVTHAGQSPIGLLSNHPRGPRMAAEGERWYRTRSWLVGPAYVLPDTFLLGFLAWFESLPEGNLIGQKGYANDDSSINEYVSMVGGSTLHPLPTIIEHRGDIDSTVGHGDKYSRERLSWRTRRWTEPKTGGGFAWCETPEHFDLEAMSTPTYWESAPYATSLMLGEG